MSIKSPILKSETRDIIHKNVESNRLTSKTSENGEAKFFSLKPGMYLVAQSEKAEVNGNEYTSKPFFVSVPQPEMQAENFKARWLYDVTASPKTENVNAIPPEPPDQTDRPHSTLVKTGDDTRLIAYGLALILAAAALAILLIKKRREGD